MIIDGAVEHTFPAQYIAKLRGIKNNGIFDIPMLKNIENNEKERDEPEDGANNWTYLYFAITLGLIAAVAVYF